MNFPYSNRPMWLYSRSSDKHLKVLFQQMQNLLDEAERRAYRKGPDGEPEIVPEEAKIIRLIAQNYLNGDSLRTIKETLESMGVPTATGNQNWSTEAIQRILQNEKYMGDVLLQKTYTADFIEGKVKKNNGELPQ